jgi:hypothetical protein
MGPVRAASAMIAPAKDIQTVSFATAALAARRRRTDRRRARAAVTNASTACRVTHRYCLFDVTNALCDSA